MTSNSKPRVAICAIAKNEGPYLREWVAYHHLLGFDPILIYDHESTDDSPAILEGLSKRGLVDFVHWTAPPKRKPQWLAYEHGVRRLDGSADWVALIDLDEFFVLPGHETIQAFLAEYQDLEAIAVNWKIFGTSGHLRKEPGLVIERFTGCATRRFSGNKAVKTLARLDAIETPRVHTCRFREGVTYRTVAGEELPPGEGKSKSVSHDVIRLNHYFTRSREEWDAKVQKGRGAKPVGHPLKHRTENHFLENERNEEQETDILRLVPAVKDVLARTPT